MKFKRFVSLMPLLFFSSRSHSLFSSVNSVVNIFFFLLSSNSFLVPVVIQAPLTPSVLVSSGLVIFIKGIITLPTHAFLTVARPALVFQPAALRGQAIAPAHPEEVGDKEKAANGNNYPG